MTRKYQPHLIAFVFCLSMAGPLAAQVRPSEKAAAPQAFSIVAENITAREAALAGQKRADNKGVIGDVLEYRLQFENRTDAPVKNVVLEDPLPKGLVYVLGSAGADQKVAVEYSIDGGRSWTQRPTVRATVDGRDVEQPAPAALYTHIRWRVTGTINPGARVTASFRARLGAAAQP